MIPRALGRRLASVEGVVSRTRCAIAASPSRGGAFLLRTQGANLAGSEALRPLVEGLLAECEGTENLFFTGNPSVHALVGSVELEERRLIDGAQSVAPMTRALTAGICAASGEVSDAESIVFGIESVSVVGSTANTCASGLVTNDALPSPNGWREALRLIYAGMPTSAGDNALRDCNAAARRQLVDNWSSLFEGGCSGCSDSHPSYNGSNALDRHDHARGHGRQLWRRSAPSFGGM